MSSAEPLPKPGPEPEGRCDGCGGLLARYGEPCSFCQAIEREFNSERFARFQDWCQAVRDELIEDRVGGLCRPIEEGPS